ncbi:MAG: hypothetical protein WAT19_07285 [Ferruginibacter sp.]
MLKNNKYLMGTCLSILLLTFLQFVSLSLVAQKKDQIRYASVVRAKNDWTENSFSVDATKISGTNESVTFTGKVYSYYNPATAKKDLSGGGFVRGDNVIVTENANNSFKLKFKDNSGYHNITLDDNSNGEISKGTYTYGNSGDTLRFIGERNGKLSATVQYTTANLNNPVGVSWSGGVTIEGNISTGEFERITAQHNINYALDNTGSPTYHFGVKDDYNLTASDNTIWIMFGISW